MKVYRLISKDLACQNCEDIAIVQCRKCNKRLCEYCIKTKHGCK